MRTFLQGEVLTANDLNTVLTTGISTEPWAFSNTVTFSNTANFSKPTTFTANVSIANTSVFYAPGSIVQANNTYLVNPTSFSITQGYNNYTDVPGLSVNITPRSANSKIYITARVFGEYNPQSGNWNTVFAVKRNGTTINLPPQPGTLPLGHHMSTLTYLAADQDSTPEVVFFDCFDSPANTATQTYNVSMCTVDAGQSYFLNRCVNAATAGGYERGTSSITVFEIAQ